MFRAPEVTIDAASQGLPVLMLAALFGPASAGFYTLGRTIMGIPAGLIGKSVGDVFYPRISEAANNREPLYPLVKKATLLLAAVGAVPFALVMAFGPSLFTLVFGAEWTTAGDYARWLALWMFFMFANNPSVKAIPVVKAQAFQLVFAIVTITLRLGALAAAYYMYQSDLAAVVAFSVLGALLNIVLVGVVLKKCKNFDELRG
jgi:peptidoglycan biosynthesis protein MviN/MurJ (putative lipid II flippase)